MVKYNVGAPLSSGAGRPLRSRAWHAFFTSGRESAQHRRITTRITTHITTRITTHFTTRTRAKRWLTAAIVGAALTSGATAGAQTAPAAPAAVPFSIGQPSLWQQDINVLTPLFAPVESASLWLTYDVQHSIVNPVAGALSA